MKLAVLAHRAGIAASYLSQIETSEGVSPSALVLYEIANALGTTVEDLLAVSTDPPRVVDDRTLPPSLMRARMLFQLADDEVELLRRIEYRGRQPETEEDWFFLICAIRYAVLHHKG